MWLKIKEDDTEKELEKFTSHQLVKELKKREGVKFYHLCEGEDKDIKAVGLASVLIVNY